MKAFGSQATQMAKAIDFAGIFTEKRMIFLCNGYGGSLGTS